MKLKDLLKIIDEYQYFQLFKGDRIGRFVKNDLGIEPYLEEGKIQTITGAIYGKVQVSPNKKMQITSTVMKLHLKMVTSTRC